jgi:hypothetical protein
MTESTKRKIVQAIAECNAFIDKESPRDASFRPADVAQHLEFCYKHRERLQKMLTEAGK